MAVDGATIYVSPAATANQQQESIAAGTYCFDTATREWDNAGEWVLPFVGEAEYVPEFGLSACRLHRLCSVSSLRPPAVRHVWADLDPPNDWSLTSLYLANLGSGRFCTTKYCAAGDDDDTYDDAGFVFTGVEVVRYCDVEIKTGSSR